MHLVSNFLLAVHLALVHTNPIPDNFNPLYDPTLLGPVTGDNSYVGLLPPDGRSFFDPSFYASNGATPFPPDYGLKTVEQPSLNENDYQCAYETDRIMCCTDAQFDNCAFCMLFFFPSFHSPPPTSQINHSSIRFEKFKHV